MCTFIKLNSIDIWSKRFVGFHLCNDSRIQLDWRIQMLLQQLLHNLPCKPIQTCHECPMQVEQYSKQGMNGHKGKSPPIAIWFHTHESLLHIKHGFFKAFMTIVSTFGTFTTSKSYMKFVYCCSRAHNALKTPPNSW